MYDITNVIFKQKHEWREYSKIQCKSVKKKHVSLIICIRQFCTHIPHIFFTPHTSFTIVVTASLANNSSYQRKTSETLSSLLYSLKV